MLYPKYIMSFQILCSVGNVPCELFLPNLFSSIHKVFHVSSCTDNIPDESHVLQYDSFELDDRFDLHRGADFKSS